MDRPRASVDKAARLVQFHAVALPDELYLSRVLDLPLMAPKDCESAIRFQVQASSPFKMDDVVWGFSKVSESAESASTMSRTLMVLASKRQIQSYLAGLSLSQAAETVEIWAFPSPDDSPVVFRGFGETLRERGVVKSRRTYLFLLAFASVLAIAAAISPLVYLRMVAIDAVKQSDALISKTRPLIQKREALMQTMQRIEFVQKLREEHVAPPNVFSMLTRALPDDTSLTGIRMEGNKISLAGQTVDTAALMQLLSNQAGIRDVRAPSPATRPLGSPKEVFTIEFLWSPSLPAGDSSVPGSVLSDKAEQATPAREGVSTPKDSPTKMGPT
jgi:general secretion pathway protein L